MGIACPNIAGETLSAALEQHRHERVASERQSGDENAWQGQGKATSRKGIDLNGIASAELRTHRSARALIAQQRQSGEAATDEKQGHRADAPRSAREMHGYLDNATIAMAMDRIEANGEGKARLGHARHS